MGPADVERAMEGSLGLGCSERVGNMLATRSGIELRVHKITDLKIQHSFEPQLVVRYGPIFLWLQ
jgi:hypothetical protein